jgi:hypothetical protein
VDSGRDRRREREHCQQHQHDRDGHQRPRPHAPSLGIHLGDDREADHAEQRAAQLPQQVEGAAPVLLHRQDRARAVQRGQAECQEHGREDEQRTRLDAHAPAQANVGARVDA